ncbi:hypothetical protein [Parafrankia elaeagni]|uniref:hypothetical protein n=1 Tax=Parafrankia elaeagni TaxID=222534 RepID=UPI0012B58BA0|nr:hypothetical protein [Parafrankia elaeagni]
MTLSPFAGLQIVEPSQGSTWPVSVLRRTDGLVAGLVPGGFDSYLRILNPFYDHRSPVVRWRDVAEDVGRKFDAETSYTDLIGPTQVSAQLYGAPIRGSLSENDTALLASVLDSHTADPNDCLFAVWDGYGWFNVAAADAGGPQRLVGPYLPYLLFAGHLAAATSVRAGTYFQSPTLWWPAERTWCVATDPDTYSTYIGGNGDLIRHLESESSLENIRVQLTDASCRGPYPPRQPR